MIDDDRSLRGIRVLVIEDDADTCELYAHALARAGAEVTAVGASDDACSAFERTRPHVVIADLGRTGDARGETLVEWIRGMADEGAGAPVAIAVAGYLRNGDRVRAIRSGFAQCLSKPVTPGELRAVVSRLVATPHGLVA